MSSYPRRTRLAAFSLVLTALSAAATAQDNAWVGGASFWDLASNWSLGLPGGGQRLFIGYSPNAFAGATTFRAGTVSVASLFSKNALNLTGGSLSLTSASETSTLDAALTLSGGTLGGAANLVVGGLTTLTGGTLGGSGKLTANGGATISGTVNIAGTRTLENKGALAWSGGTVNVASGATVSNAGGSTFAANAAGTWTGGNLNNAGNLVHSANTTTFSGVALTNTGTIESSGGLLRFVNPTSYSNAGTIKASGSGRVSFEGGSYDVTGAGLETSGNGQISFAGATLTGGSWAPWTIPGTAAAGSISLTSSTLRVGLVKNSDLLGLFGENTLDGVAGDRGFKFLGGGTQTILNGFTPGGAVTLDYGARLRFTGDRTVDYAIDVLESSTIPSSGILASPGSKLTIGTGGSMTGAGGKINADGAAFNFRNDGTLSASAALAVDVAGGSLTNTGLIVATGADDPSVFPRSALKVGEGSFVNSGTIRADGTGLAIQGTGAATFGNTGTIEAVNGGSVGIFQNPESGGIRWTNAGVLRADGANSRLYLGGTFTRAGLGDFSVTNGASAVIYGGTLDNAGQTLTVGSPNAWMLYSGGRIKGGSVVGSANLGFDDIYMPQFLENVNLDGGLNFSGGSARLVGTTRLNGAVTGVGRVEFTDDVTLDHDVTGNIGLRMTKAGGKITIASGTTYASGVNFAGTPSYLGANVVNNGTIRGTGPGYSQANLTNNGLFEQIEGGLTFYNPGGLVNNGTFRVSGTGGVYIGDSGRVTNNGTMLATVGGTLWFDSFASSQPLLNAGTIQATGAGSSIRFDFDKAFTLGDLGNVSATDGAYLSVFGSGKLNLAGGALTLGSGGQGSWRVEGGGTIYGGSIVNSELLGLNSNLNRQTLRDVTVDHGLNVGAGFVSLEGSFRSGGAITATGSGRVYTSLSRDIDYAIRFDGAANENGSVELGTQAFGANATIATNGEVSGRNLWVSQGPNSLKIENRGLLMARGGGGQVEIASSLQNVGTVRATDGGTLRIGDYGTLLNVSGSTLTGGTYRADANSRIQVRGLDLHENAASIVLDGAGSRLEDLFGNDGLRNLAVNSGSLAISGGRNLSLNHALQNAGTLGIGPESTFAVTGAFAQTSTGHLRLGLGLNGAGLLAVNGAVSLAGALDVSLLNGYVPTVGSRYTFLTTTGALSGTLSVDASRYSLVYGANSVSLQVNAVPEPASLAVLTLGAAALLRRRGKRS